MQSNQIKVICKAESFSANGNLQVTTLFSFCSRPTCLWHSARRHMQPSWQSLQTGKLMWKENWGVSVHSEVPEDTSELLFLSLLLSDL